MIGIEGFINVLLVIFIFWILYLATRPEVFLKKENIANEYFFCPMSYRNYQQMRRAPPVLKYRYEYY